MAMMVMQNMQAWHTLQDAIYAGGRSRLLEIGTLSKYLHW